MPSSSSASPPGGGWRGAAEEGGGGGRLEEVRSLGLSWILEPPTGAMSDTKTTRNISKTMGSIFSVSIYGMVTLDVAWGRATYWLCI